MTATRLSSYRSDGTLYATIGDAWIREDERDAGFYAWIGSLEPGDILIADPSDMHINGDGSVSGEALDFIGLMRATVTGDPDNNEAQRFADLVIMEARFAELKS